MKIALLFAVAALSLSISAYAHEGKTDISGGHGCHAKASEQGLCSEYHYHKPKRRNYGHVAKVQHQEKKQLIAPGEKLE